MKVLHIIDNLGKGGAQKMFLFFVKKAQIEDFKILGYSLKRSNEKLENLKSFKSYSNISLSRLFELKSLVSDPSISIIHLHLNNAVFHGFMLGQLLGVKKSWIIHEHGEVFRKDLVGIIIRRIYKSFSNAQFIAVSNAVQKELMAIGVASQNVTLIKNVAFIESSIKIKPNDTEILRIGYVGRVTSRKNWQGFLEVVKNLKGNNKFQFRVYGDGPELVKMKNQAEKIGEILNLEFFEWQSNPEDIYSNLDVVLLLSNWEGFSLVQLEALYYGKPVVAFSNKGMLETQVNEGTIYCPTNNIVEVSKVLNNLMENKEFYAESQQAALNYSKKHTTRSYLNKLADFYKAQVNK